MPSGFLAVTSQPSSQLSLSDFHAWYEEEHIPLRLNHLPAFLSGVRYKAATSDTDDVASTDTSSGPGWLAMYEISDTSAFEEESYTSLRTNRSAREASVMSRLEELTRIAGEELVVCEGSMGATSTGLKLGQPSGYVLTHLLDVEAGGHTTSTTDLRAEEWLETVASEAGVGGARDYARSRLVKITDSGKTKMGAPSSLSADEQAPYFVIHEFTRNNRHSIERFWSLLSITGNKVLQKREWELYKAYPCITQGNLQ